MRLLILCAICLLATSAAASILPNGGFEAGAEGWTIPEGIMRIDNSVAHTGTSSLRASWDDPGKRLLALHELPIHPGKRYLIKAWLKSDNVHGAFRGFTFGIEWGSATEFIGGSYPMGIGWTADWTEVSFLSSVVPEKATWGHIFATTDWGGVGTGWIDDISVTEVDTVDAFKWRLERDTVVGSEYSDPFGVVIESVAPEAFGEEVEVTASLCSPPWNTQIAEKKLSGERAEFETGKLNEGVYKISCAVKSRKTGRTLLEPEFRTCWKRPPMQCLTVPQSGILLPGSKWPALDVRPYQVGMLTGEVVDASGVKVAGIPDRMLQKGKDSKISISGKPPAPGRYEICLKLAWYGLVDYVTVLPFTVLSADEAARGVVIGPDNLLRDRGKVWFPMFVYAHTAYDFEKKAETDGRDPAITKDVLEHLTGTPFGLLDYATPTGGLEETVALADRCARRGIRLALSVKDVYPNWGNAETRAKGFPGQSTEQIVRSLARRLKDHPALAIYYTNDELSTQYFADLRDMRQWLHEEDPLHPTLHVHYDLECIRELVPCYDIWGHELYPWPSDELQRMAEWSDRITSTLPKTVPFWGCLWAFRGEPNARDLQRSLAYTAIARGARGLLFYSYYDLKLLPNFDERWKDLVELGREIESRLPILLQPESDRPCRTRTKDVVLRTVSGDKGTWLLAVNTGKNERSAVITVDPRFKRATEGSKALDLSAGRLRLKLDPFGVKLIELR